jgi:hypothetical protein
MPRRYDIQKDPDELWTVYDKFTGWPAELDGLVLAGLSERAAKRSVVCLTSGTTSTEWLASRHHDPLDWLRPSAWRGSAPGRDSHAGTHSSEPGERSALADNSAELLQLIPAEGKRVPSLEAIKKARARLVAEYRRSRRSGDNPPRSRALAGKPQNTSPAS